MLFVGFSENKDKIIDYWLKDQSDSYREICSRTGITYGLCELLSHETHSVHQIRLIYICKYYSDLFHLALNLDISVHGGILQK